MVNPPFFVSEKRYVRGRVYCHSGSTYKLLRMSGGYPGQFLWKPVTRFGPFWVRSQRNGKPLEDFWIDPHGFVERD
jgi:hypothetical protein